MSTSVAAGPCVGLKKHGGLRSGRATSSRRARTHAIANRPSSRALVAWVTPASSFASRMRSLAVS